VHENRRFSLARWNNAAHSAAVDAYAMASGRTPRARFPRHLTAPPPRPRWTPAARLELIPIETLDARALHTRFAITPPWRKAVFRDPEDEGT
jgi:hypothetical protein